MEKTTSSLGESVYMRANATRPVGPEDDAVHFNTSFAFPRSTIAPTNSASSAIPAVAPFDAQETDEEEESRRKKHKRQAETLCTMICTELDPRSIVKWPSYFVHSVAVGCQVLATVRFITMADVIAGLINACLLFAFAAVFSSAVFGDLGLDQYVALGTGCNLITIVILQGAFTLYSDAGANVAGPDFNPTIFLATMAGIIKDTMIQNQRDAFESGGRHRQLSSSSTSSPTPSGMGVDPKALLATILAMIMVASATFGVFLYVLGRLKISRCVQLVPGSVLAGFMACIGYLVAYKAIKTTMTHEVWDQGPSNPMFWAFFLPSLPIGILMYMQRRYNYGSPVIYLPLILITPLVLFFVIVYASGSDIEQARLDGWLFASFASELFYSQWVASYGNYNLVDWGAVGATAPTMVTMMIIVAIEAVLKQATTRKILKAPTFRIDHELMLAGKANILASLFTGVVGYPQPKLTYINYGIQGNSTSRVSGMIIIVFNAAIFFAGFPLVNYLPRFWLAGILFFAAMGFLVENLIDSFWYYSFKEFVCIWAIVIVNAILGLLWAVIIGIALSALIFALAYSRGGTIKAIFSGSDYRSGVYRTRQEETKLNHLASKVIVIQLHRYIFFGSAAYVNEVVTGLIKEQDTKCTEVRRAAYFIFDWKRVENIDMTAMGVFAELMLKLTHTGKRTVLFTGLTPKLRKKLTQQNVVQQIHPLAVRKLVASASSTREDTERGIINQNRRCFDTLDRGMEFVEDALLEWSVSVRERWFHFPALQDFYVQANYWNLKHSFDQILKELLGSDMQRFFDLVQVKQGWTICKKGDYNHNLYVLTEGSLTVLLERKQKKRHLPNITRLQTLRPGAFVNEDSLYEDFTVPYTVVADVDSTVLALSREGMNQLERQFPLVSIEIHRRVLNHSNRSRRKVVSMLNSLSLWDQEFAPVVTATATIVLASPESQPSSDAVSSSLVEANTPRTPSEVSFSPVQPQQPVSDLPDLEAQTVPPGSASPSRTVLPPPPTLERQISTLSGTSTAKASLLESTKDAAHAVLQFPTQVVAAGLVLSGLKEDSNEDREDDDDDSLLNLDHIRDGEGEEEGKQVAQRLLRRRSSAPAMCSFNSVMAFRAQKGLLAEDAGEAAVGAIYHHAHTSSLSVTTLEMETTATPVVNYCLHPDLLLDAKTAFYKVTRGKEEHIPKSKLNVALAGVGLFTKHSFADELVSLDDFLQLAVGLNSPPLRGEVVARLYMFFVRAVNSSQEEGHGYGGGGGLTAETLNQMLPGLSPLACGRFVNVWGSGGRVDFDSICSAVANHVKTVEMDLQVEAAWRELNNNTEYTHSEDVAAQLGLDLLQCQEMIWEADLDVTDALSLFELLETLSYNHTAPKHDYEDDSGKEEEEQTTAVTAVQGKAPGH